METPPLARACGEPSEGHEARGVQSEREGVLLRGQPVDALQHIRRPGEVGEECGVREAAHEHGADEAAIAEQRTEITCGLRQAAAGAAVGGQRFGELQGHGQQDGAADGGEEDEQPAPVGDDREQPAEQRTDDR